MGRGRPAGRVFPVLSWRDSRGCEPLRVDCGIPRAVAAERTVRQPRPAPPRPAGFRTHLAVLRLDAMAGTLRVELSADCRFHVVDRPYRAVEVARYWFFVLARHVHYLRHHVRCD